MNLFLDLIKMTHWEFDSQIIWINRRIEYILYAGTLSKWEFLYIGHIPTFIVASVPQIGTVPLFFYLKLLYKSGKNDINVILFALDAV